MNERHLQERFLVPFFTDAKNGLGYREVKANTIRSTLIIEEDLEEFISNSTLNKKPYQTLLDKYQGNSQALLADLMELIQERSAASRNMALFLNTNKTVSLKSIKLHLFYPADSVIHDDKLFEQNIFSVVQEFPYDIQFEGKSIVKFRPDLCFFVNGIYLGYSELKSNFNNQSAAKNGRKKVIADYFNAVKAYHKIVDSQIALSDKEKESLRKDALKIFEKAIHITTTDIGETYVIRNISDFFESVLVTCREGKLDRQQYEKEALHVFKPYPLLNPGAEKKEKLKEIFTFHYGKPYLEKEILYYNFIEREVRKVRGVKELKDEKGRLISPRPKQKFGTDKIMNRIDEFLMHESDDDYFIRQLEEQLAGVSADIRKQLIEKRKSYANNKNVYSLLMQYAAGFGKSNIIGWSALQLKDLRRDGEYVYDKIMIVVDRVQLRAQIDSKMLNMNIDRRMFKEAYNKTSFLKALKSDTRLVIVNLQKFGSVREMLDKEVLEKLSTLRIVFLIDEIHRSNKGVQHEEMINIFDELQASFDSDDTYNTKRKKKNLIIGFTATPDDNALSRFGEFSGYAESEKIWVPFDSYTMREAIEDGYILNPLKNIVPVASKMLFDLPDNELEGFTAKQYKDAQKAQIYENRDRIDAVAAYVADLLVKDVYRQIRGTAKAMLAVYSIKAAIAYKERVSHHFAQMVQQPKFARYAEAPIFVIYSDSQDEQTSSLLNDGLTEQKVLDEFARCKNGLVIVVAKLQTGFDERRLHTLFLDKEISHISAIQAISRVNRTIKYKNDCKVVDFSHGNVNVQNIKNAFEHFSDMVVSDFDPFSDQRVMDIDYQEMQKSPVSNQFKTPFLEAEKEGNPEALMDVESSLKQYIPVHIDHCKDIKAKAAQFFSILNRLEYVITLDTKYSDAGFLSFWRFFNKVYNGLYRTEDIRDEIDVYFDNKIGMIEKEPKEPKKKKKKNTEVAVGGNGGGYQFSIMEVIEARNKEEENIKVLIQEFEQKIEDFFRYVKTSQEGERLVVKINSSVAEDEIYEDFAKIYRKYRALNRKKVGEFFFKETADLVEKLCDDFEQTVKKPETESKAEQAQQKDKVIPLSEAAKGFSTDLQDSYPHQMAADKPGKHSESSANTEDGIDPIQQEKLKNIKQLTDDRLHPFLSELVNQGLPIPDIGYELVNEKGAVIAEAELAWEKLKIACLWDHQMVAFSEFEKDGWKIFGVESLELDYLNLLNLISEAANTEDLNGEKHM